MRKGAFVMQTELVVDKQKSKSIIICGFVAQLLMLVVSSAILFTTNISLLSISQNIVLFRNFFCVALSTIIFFGFIRQGSYSIEKVYFILMNVAISTALTADLITWVVDGNPAYVEINSVCIAVDIMANSVLDFLFWKFIKYSYDPEGKTYKKFEEKLVFVLMIMGCILAIADLFLGFGFNVDEMGVTHTILPGGLLLYISPLLISLMMLVSIARIKLSRREKLIVFLYLIVPLIAFCIYLFNDSNSSSFYPIIFATYLFIFCNLVVHRERENAENIALLSGTKKELDVATKIQTSILPLNFSDFDKLGVDLFASMGAAKEVGGDFYDFFMIDESKIAIVIADVSGKGVPAAMFMMRAKSLVKSTAKSDLSPGAVLTKVNEILCIDNSEKMFVTVWLGIIDLNNKKLTFANAGHNYPIITNEEGEISFLENKPSLVLAGMKNIKYQDNEVDFCEGMSIYLYTDGVTEAKDKNNNQFGDDRLLDAMALCKDYDMEGTCSSIKEKVQEFSIGVPQFDDITMLGLKINNNNIVNVLYCNTKKESFEKVKKFFEGFSKKYGISKSVENKILVIADEIYSNIFKYSGASRAIITANINNDKLNICFTDNGIPYNPLDKQDPDISLSAEDREIGGLGIFVVKNMSERIEYNRVNGDNILEIVLKL